MRIFLSFASEQRTTAERIKYALEETGHVVFFDAAELTGSQPFTSTIAQALTRADLLVFLLSPESVQPARYAHSELHIIRRLGRHPAGFALPVMVSPVDRALIPPYLAAVTIFQPAGDVAADVATEVSRIERNRNEERRRRLIAGVAVLGLLGGGAAAIWHWRVNLEGGTGEHGHPPEAVRLPTPPAGPPPPKTSNPPELALEVETRLEVHRGEWVASDAERDPRVRNDDQVQFDVTVSQPVFLYVFNWSEGDRALTPLFPHRSRKAVPVAAGAHVVLPDFGRFFKIRGAPGREEFFFVGTPAPLPELDRLARELEGPSGRQQIDGGLQILTRGVSHASTAGSKLRRERGVAGLGGQFWIREVATGAGAHWHRVALEHVK